MTPPLPSSIRKPASTPYSGRIVSAVDQHIGAGHEARRVAGEKHRGGRDLAWLTEPAEQMFRTRDAPRFFHAAEAEYHPARLDRAGRERVDAHVLCRVVRRHGFR